MAKSERKKTTTKKGQLVRMLRTQSGADMAKLSLRLGWQPHTTRAAITALRKSGHVVVLTKSHNRGASSYRIIGTTSKETATEVQNAG